MRHILKPEFGETGLSSLATQGQDGRGESGGRGPGDRGVLGGRAGDLGQRGSRQTEGE